MKKLLIISQTLCLLLILAAGNGLAATDAQITSAIERELASDPMVRQNRINVDTLDGIVTLSGTAELLRAKDRAADLAASVRGVQAVVNEINIPPSANRSDGEIEDLIRKALLRNPATESYEVTVSVEDGFATLEGMVDSFAEARLARQVAANIVGVRGIEDHIEVDLDTGEVDIDSDRTDREIRNEIVEAMRMDSRIGDDLIEVEVNEGRVMLSGTVRSMTEKNLAIVKAWVLGVKQVDADGLEVASEATRTQVSTKKFNGMTNERIKAALETSLTVNPWVSVSNLEVRVEDGIITLSGQVDTLRARREASREASQTTGVREVVNELKVRPPEQLTDAQIETAVGESLADNPWLADNQLMFKADDGKVTLSGEVDSLFERIEAGKTAAMIKGVEEVKNHLIVADDAEQTILYDPFIDSDYYHEPKWYQVETFTSLFTDEHTEDTIRKELFWSPFVDADQVTVNVDAGVATLSGEVDSMVERYAVIENAFEGGAAAVVDKLTVK